MNTTSFLVVVSRVLRDAVEIAVFAANASKPVYRLLVPDHDEAAQLFEVVRRYRYDGPVRVVHKEAP